MNRSNLLVALVILVLAVPTLDSLIFTSGQSTAVGQDAKPVSQWEYKSVRFPANDPLEQTKILNNLAVGGWEHVGLIQPVYTRDGEYAPNSYVAFRRPSQ